MINLTLTNLIVAALATWQAVEIWHHSELFAGWRSYVESVGGWTAALLRCPFCLAPWVAFSMSAAVLGVSEGAQFLQLFVFALAVARLANLGNDLLYDKCRTPKNTVPTGEPETPSDTPAT